MNPHSSLRMVPPFISEQDFLRAYDEYADAIFRHCYFRILHRQRSKQLMCESFKRLWLFIADGNAVDSLKLFLYRAIDALIDEEERAMAMTDRHMAMRDAEHELAAVLERLPQDQRRTFVLHFIDGFSAQEISDIIGGSPLSHASALQQQEELLVSLASPSNSSSTTYAS